MNPRRNYGCMVEVKTIYRVERAESYDRRRGERGWEGQGQAGALADQ